MRAFLAVPADPTWVESTRELLARVRDSLPRCSWTRPEAWHLTLRFLGEIREEAAEELAAMVGVRVSQTGGGDLAASGAVVFPPRGRPRVLGIGFAAGAAVDALVDLAAVAEAAARKIGVTPEDRSFRPHVTLGRLRDPWPLDAILAFRREADMWKFPLWRVRSCVLYRSRLDPSGAVHTPVREWRMAGDAMEAHA